MGWPGLFATALAFFYSRSLVAQQEKDPSTEDKKPAQEQPARQEPVHDLPDDEPEGFFLEEELRIGGWGIASFNASTPGGHRKIASSLLFDAGLDVRAQCDGWILELTGDGAVGKSLRMNLGGLLLGSKFELVDEPLPMDLEVAIGPVVGRLSVNQQGFGHFSSGGGFEARVSGVAWLEERIGLTAWVDYRQLSFKYDPVVLTGDTRTSGATIAFGAGVVIRF
jgi:hypothetical protein